MKKGILILYLLVKCYDSAVAQENLVPNPDFDTEINCGNGPGTIAHWFIPNPKEISLTNLCPFVDWWRFIRDKKYGYNGSQCGYIETYYKGFADDNIYSGRIYIAVKLTQPLTAGKEYYFEMKVRAVDTFPNFKLVNTIFTNSQDVAFVRDQPVFDYDIPRNYLQIRPTVTSKLHADYNWHTVSACFTAEGHERYMVIGNFRNDANTETFTTGKRNPNFPNGLIANYAIDDVILTETHIGIKDTAICSGEKLEIKIKKSIPTNLQYRWNDGSTSSSFTTDKPGAYSVIFHYGSACTHTEPFTLTVFPPDYKANSIDKKFCKGKELVLSAAIGASNEKIKWNTGASSDEIIVSRPGIYTANIENKCTQYKQDFKVTEELCEDGVYIPNAFVANTINTFKPIFKSDFPIISNYLLMIFDRWGSMVFKANKPDLAWDGSDKGHLLNSGVYLYYLRFDIMVNDKLQSLVYKGDVTVLK